MEYVLNEDKVKEFLSNKELPLDYIFDEIQGLFTNDIIQEILNLPFDIFDESNLCFLIEEAVNINNQDQNTSNEIKNSENLNNIKQLSEKQLSRMKAKQLQNCQSLQQDLYRNANNFNDPKFCTQAIQNPKQFMVQNTTSLQNVPKNIRSQLITPPQQDDKFNLKKILSKTFSTAFKIFMPMLTIEYIGSTLGNIKVIAMSRSKEGLNVVATEGFSILRWAGNKIGNLVGYGNVFQTNEYAKKLTNISPEMRDSIGSVVGLNTGFYIVVALFVCFTVIPFVKKIYNAITKKKKEQYAQTNNILKENVTIEMLYESNDKYYLELAVLNEAENVINATKPTSKMGSLLKIVNKGIINLLKLSKGTEEALRNNSISCFTAAISNFLISVGNIVLVLAKGALLLMISKEEKQRQEQNLRDQREEVLTKK